MRISDWSSDVCSSDLDTAMEEQDNTAEIIRDLAAIKVGEFGGVPYAIVPRTHELKLLEQLAPPKTFVARGKVQAHDVQGFVDYINKFKLATQPTFAALEHMPQPKTHTDHPPPTATRKTR